MDLRDAADLEERGRDHGAGVAGGDERLGLAALGEPRGDADRGVSLLADALGRRLGHLDHFGGVDDAGEPVADTETLGLGEDLALFAHERHVERGPRLAKGLQRALDHRARRQVASHRIHPDDRALPVVAHGRWRG